MAKIKSLYFTNNNSIIQSAYVMDNDALKITNISTNIARNAFKNDSTVECVLLNPGVKTVEESAFENCKELQLVEYVEGNEILGYEENDKNEKTSIASTSDNISIQYHAFKDCIKLHTVLFPQTKDKTHLDLHGKVLIEKEAFLGCKELRTVVLYNTSVEIADDAFKGCDSDRLVFVVSENSVTERFAREHGFRFIHPDNIA